MTRPEFLRLLTPLLAGLVVAVVSIGAGYLTWRYTSPGDGTAQGLDGSATAALGADFELANQHGGTTRLADLRGDAVLLFFGYTHCPDICPGTLYAMSQARARLGPRAERVQGVFVTVDPERDTPERLREYLAHFDDSFLGLTGSPGELAAVARTFGAAFEKGDVDDAGGYLMGHTTFGYLLDTEGRVVKLYPADAAPEDMASGLTAVLDAAG